MSKFLLITLLFLSILVSNAQQSDSTKQTSNRKFEISKLEQKVNTLKELNSKVLNSVYWTLGTLSTIFTAFLALNFFSNLSINRRKIETIKKELENAFTKKIDENQKISFEETTNNFNKLKKDFERQSDDFSESQRLKTENFIQEVNKLIAVIEETSKEHIKILAERTDTLRQDFDVNQKQVEETFDERVNELINPVKSTFNIKLNSLKDEIHELNRNNLDVYVNNESNAVANRRRYCLNLLNLDRQKGWDWRIHSTLELLVNILKLDKPNFKEIGEVQIEIDKLDQKKFSIPIEQVVSVLKEKSVSNKG